MRSRVTGQRNLCIPFEIWYLRFNGNRYLLLFHLSHLSANGEIMLRVRVPFVTDHEYLFFQILLCVVLLVSRVNGDVTFCCRFFIALPKLAFAETTVAFETQTNSLDYYVYHFCEKSKLLGMKGVGRSATGIFGFWLFGQSRIFICFQLHQRYFEKFGLHDRFKVKVPIKSPFWFSKKFGLKLIQMIFRSLGVKDYFQLKHLLGRF